MYKIPLLLIQDLLQKDTKVRKLAVHGMFMFICGCISYINKSGMLVCVCSQGRWLYALLACLDKPLLPEAHSLIRQLARRCSAVRAQMVLTHSYTVPHISLYVRNLLPCKFQRILHHFLFCCRRIKMMSDYQH